MHIILPSEVISDGGLAHLSDLVGDVLTHVLHRHEQAVLVRGGLFGRRYGAVRVSL